MANKDPETRYTIRLLHNGKVLLEGPLEELHNLPDHQLRYYQFDLGPVLVFEILREKVLNSK